LMKDLATITKNQVRSLCHQSEFTFEKVTQPTPLQLIALDLLGASLYCTQSSGRE
jgi:hypothetical protein